MIVLLAVAIAAAIVGGLIGYGLWYVWDMYRDRGSVTNPLSGSGKVAKAPTTAELRAARRGTTEVAPWRLMAWDPGPKPPWPDVVDEGRVVELHIEQVVYRLRVLTRAFRIGQGGREYVDYLGEAADEWEPFRATFQQGNIWVVI